MKTSVNLTIDDKLLAQLKLFASQNNTSISELVETFFRNTLNQPKKNNIIDFVEGLKPTRISNDTDLKDVYRSEIDRKYGS